MYTIRPIADGDYEGLAAIRNRIQPEPMSARELRESDQREQSTAGTTWLRFVMVDSDNRVRAFANINHPFWMPEGRWNIYVAVHPDARGQRLARQLYEFAERFVQERGATMVEAWSRGEDDAALNWARRRGFRLDRQRTESVLDLKSWDGSRFAGHLDEVRAQGVELVTYTDFPPATIARAVYETDIITTPDVPVFEPDTKIYTYEEWEKELRDDPTPKIYALAIDGGKVAGFSYLCLPQSPGAGARTWYTAVRREYRGRGIALAVKLLTIEAALERGVPHMRTNNDPDNPAMLAVNEKLGYQLIPGPRRLKKPLGPGLVRPARPDDYAAIAAIRNLINPDPALPEQMRNWDEIEAKTEGSILIRLVVENQEGNVVGYALSKHSQWSREGSWWIHGGVHPDARGRGFGSQVLETAETFAREHGAKELESNCRGEDDASLNWALRRGCILERERTESVLGLKAWDGSRFAGHLDRVRTAGFELVLTYGVPEESLARTAHAVMVESFVDVPGFDGKVPEFDVWYAQLKQEVSPQAWAVALEGGKAVGLSILELPVIPGGAAYTSYTGVLRSHRGKGIALAVKLLTIEAALSREASSMRTNNDPDNPAMLAVNEKLGYQMVPGPRSLKKHLV